MLLHIPDVLTAEEAALCRGRLHAADWVDGRGTAGHLSHGVKENQQLRFDNPVALELGEMITRRLETHPMFMSAALPSRMAPPLFNRYGVSQHYGDHVDGAIRPIDGTPHRMRTDLSATLFLSELDEYDGGELVIEEPFGPQRARLPAGALLLYPASRIHRIEPVTRGVRLASFFWVQSLVRDDADRAVLFELDSTLRTLPRETEAEKRALLSLTNVYHNLVRRWADA
ncbi:MAG TPA: Fe2+-dependent dioxygenase [Caulobacteraceae bacterium]|jgi:PKHD-type hydroxylase